MALDEAWFEAAAHAAIRERLQYTPGPSFYANGGGERFKGLNDLTLHDENFFPTITQTADSVTIGNTLVRFLPDLQLVIGFDVHQSLVTNRQSLTLLS